MTYNESIQNRLSEHLPQIRRVVQRIAKEEGVVDDIVQECCLHIMVKGELYQDKGRVQQWMNAVVRNFTLNFLYKRTPKTKTFEETEFVPEPAREGFSEDRIRWVFQQVQYLSSSQAHILRARYFEGKKLEQIASELQISHQAVSAQLERALSTLRKRAQKQGVLAALLPWNWKLHSLFRSTGTSAKTALLAGVGISSAFFLGYIWIQSNSESGKPETHVATRGSKNSDSTASEAISNESKAPLTETQASESESSSIRTAMDPNAGSQFDASSKFGRPSSTGITDIDSLEVQRIKNLLGDRYEKARSLAKQYKVSYGRLDEPENFIELLASQIDNQSEPYSLGDEKSHVLQGALQGELWVEGSYKTLVLMHRPIAESRIRIKTYASLFYEGDMDGEVDIESYSSIVVDGTTYGRITVKAKVSTYAKLILIAGRGGAGATGKPGVNGGDGGTGGSVWYGDNKETSFLLVQPGGPGPGGGGGSGSNGGSGGISGVVAPSKKG